MGCGYWANLTLTPASIWPSLKGDHRAALRSSARGAAHGRVRWFARASGAILVDADGRIFVISSDDVQLFDVSGSGIAAFDLPSGGPWNQCALTAGGLVVSNGTELLALHIGGTTRWRKRLNGVIKQIHVAPDGELVVWSRISGESTRHSSVLTWLKENGDERWSGPHAVDVPGYVRDTDWYLVFDDAGYLFASSHGRLGDGVSGDDRATGGLAAYDALGNVVWTMIPEDEDWQSYPGFACGLASGILLRLLGGEQRAYDERGTLRWHKARQTTQPGLRVKLAGLDLEFSEPLNEASELLRKRGEGSYAVLKASIDGAGNRYFVCEQKVISIDPALNLRWSLSAPGAENWRSPAIAGDGTILVDCGEQLMAVE